MKTLKNEIETWGELLLNMQSPMGLINRYSEYIDLLKQVPKMGDFVECDMFGQQMTEPDIEDISEEEAYEGLMLYFKEAKSRVKWQGWEHAESGTIVNRELSISIYTTADGGLCTHDKQLLTYSDLTDMGLIFKR